MSKKVTSFEFSTDSVDLKDRERVYQGYAHVDKFTFSHKRFDGTMSATISRECFFSGDAVMVIPYDPRTEEVVLIEQFRVAPYAREGKPWMFECIAGRTEPGEDPSDVAQREAEEEAGCKLHKVMNMGAFYISPGIFGEYMTFFCATADLSNVGGIHGLDSEHEDIRVITVPLKEANKAVADGRIVSAPTALALSLLAQHKTQLLG